MALLRNIASGLRSLFRKEQVSKDQDEELNGFMEMAAEEKMKQGMSRKDALRAVRLERGSLEVTKEVVRSAAWESVVETYWQDLRFAARMLRKSPGFTVVAVLTLALSIGANTAIFGLANAAFFRAVPYPHAERLAFLWQDNQRTGETEGTVSYPNYADWRAQSQSFEDMAFMGSDDVLLAKGGTLQHVPVGEVSTNFLSVLGVSPLLGRDFTHYKRAPLLV